MKQVISQSSLFSPGICNLRMLVPVIWYRLLVWYRYQLILQPPNRRASFDSSLRLDGLDSGAGKIASR
jgi:hypothetical protein